LEQDLVLSYLVKEAVTAGQYHKFLLMTSKGMFVSTKPFIHLEQWEGGINDTTQEMLFQILHTWYYICANGEMHTNLKHC